MKNFYRKTIRRLAITAALILLGTHLIDTRPALSASQTMPSHLRLIDRLDRPHDGYCLDIPGPPTNFFIQFPLFAHNCMPTLAPDNTVVLTSEGYIRFPAVDQCVTVTGVKTTLPGAAVMLGDCNPSNPFIDISKRQRFTLHGDGRLVIAGTGYCLAVGTQSAETLSPVHRWRTLFVDDCVTTPVARSRWEFVVPNK